MNGLDFLRGDAHPMLGELVEARSFDPETGIYECGGTLALFFEMAPMIGITEDQVTTLNSMFSEMDLGRGFAQILNWASPMIGPILKRWRDGQRESTPARLEGRTQLFRQAALGEKFGHLNWRLRHYRVFLAIIIPSSGRDSRAVERLMKIRTAVLRTLEAIGGEGMIVRPNRPAGSLSRSPDTGSRLDRAGAGRLVGTRADRGTAERAGSHSRVRLCGLHHATRDCA